MSKKIHRFKRIENIADTSKQASELSKQEVWIRAFCSVASCFNSKENDATRWADTCVKEYEKRFITPK